MKIRFDQTTTPIYLAQDFILLVFDGDLTWETWQSLGTFLWQCNAFILWAVAVRLLVLSYSGIPCGVLLCMEKFFMLHCTDMSHWWLAGPSVSRRTDATKGWPHVALCWLVFFFFLAKGRPRHGLIGLLHCVIAYQCTIPPFLGFKFSPSWPLTKY